MVNSKDYAQDYNSYYRPSLDDDDETFFPKQGMLPIYYFKNGHLVSQTTQYLREEEVEDIETYDDDIKSNYYLYFIGLLLFIVFYMINWLKCIKWKSLYDYFVK